MGTHRNDTNKIGRMIAMQNLHEKAVAGQLLSKFERECLKLDASKAAPLSAAERKVFAKDTVILDGPGSVRGKAKDERRKRLHDAVVAGKRPNGKVCGKCGGTGKVSWGSKDGFRPRDTPKPRLKYESFLDTIKRLKEEQAAAKGKDEQLKYVLSLKNGRAIVEASSKAEAAKVGATQHGDNFVRVLGLMNGVGKDVHASYNPDKRLTELRTKLNDPKAGTPRERKLWMKEYREREFDLQNGAAKGKDNLRQDHNRAVSLGRAIAYITKLYGANALEKELHKLGYKPEEISKVLKRVAAAKDANDCPFCSVPGAEHTPANRKDHLARAAYALMDPDQAAEIYNVSPAVIEKLWAKVRGKDATSATEAEVRAAREAFYAAKPGSKEAGVLHDKLLLLESSRKKAKDVEACEPVKMIRPMSEAKPPKANKYTTKKPYSMSPHLETKKAKDVKPFDVDTDAGSVKIVKREAAAGQTVAQIVAKYGFSKSFVEAEMPAAKDSVQERPGTGGTERDAVINLWDGHNMPADKIATKLKLSVGRVEKLINEFKRGLDVKPVGDAGSPSDWMCGLCGKKPGAEFVAKGTPDEHVVCAACAKKDVKPVGDSETYRGFEIRNEFIQQAGKNAWTARKGGRIKGWNMDLGMLKLNIDHGECGKPVGDTDEESAFEKALAKAKVGSTVVLQSGFGYHCGQNFGRLAKPVSGKIEIVQGSDIYVRVNGEKERWKFPIMAIET